MDRNIEAIDAIQHARHLFEAALMALGDLSDQRQRAALDALIYDGLKGLVTGLEALGAAAPEAGGEAK
jgi:hypothetical protein